MNTENNQYIVGIDTGSLNSNGALVVVKHASGKPPEIIRVATWPQKQNFFIRWKFRILMWKLYFKYYRRVTVIVEGTSEFSKPDWFADIRVVIGSIRSNN